MTLENPTSLHLLVYCYIGLGISVPQTAYWLDFSIHTQSTTYMKIAPAALLVSMYWMNVRIDSHPLHMAIMITVLGFYTVFAYYDKRTELFDELAKESLRRSDSVCLKILFAFGVIAVASLVTLNCTAIDLIEVSGVMIGYGIAFILFLFTVLRAFVFWFIDKRGI